MIAKNSGKIHQLWLDLTEAFTLSGGLTSTATTTLAASDVLNNALKINTIPYQYPSTQGASSTVLSNNGSGILYNVPLPWLKIGEALFAGAATTTVTLTATSTSRDIHIVILGTVSGTNSCNPTLAFNQHTTLGAGANYSYSYNSSNGAAVSGTSVNVIRLNTPSGSVANPNIHFDINMTNDASIAKYITWTGGEHPSAGGAINAQSVGVAVLADTTNQLKAVSLGIKCDSGASTITAGRITVYASQN